VWRIATSARFPTSCGPEYRRQIEQRDEPPQIAGYRAVNMVQVTVDTVSAMGRIIDTAIASGANRVANISFRLRDPHAAHLEALAIAMRNARREAEAVAEAAGERLGPALNISTGGYQPPMPPVPMYAGRAEWTWPWRRARPSRPARSRSWRR
jgi:uncharacterized protein